MEQNLNGIYRGFSTRKWVDGARDFSVTDIECVREDLFNHIETAFGERPHLPEFGTRVPELAFEQLDQVTIQALKTDLEAVVAFDPRVKLNNLQVFALANENTIVAALNVTYVEFHVQEDLRIEIPSE